MREKNPCILFLIIISESAAVLLRGTGALNGAVTIPGKNNPYPDKVEAYTIQSMVVPYTVLFFYFNFTFDLSKVFFTFDHHNTEA